MVDTHCHLDVCEPPDEELVAQARAVGVRRLATIGMDGPSIERALAAANRFDDVIAVVGRHPNSAEGFGDADLAEIERAAADPRVRAIGETGLDYFRDHAPHEDQRRAFEAQVDLAQRLGLPLVVHTRAAEEDTFDVLRERAEGLTVIMHCFSTPDRVEECVERGWLCSFAGNVTYRNATDLQEAARAVPNELLLVETDSPFLAPQPLRGKPNEPANVVTTAEFVADLRGVGYTELERDRGAQRGARLRLVSAPAPRQASLRRMREFGVRPNRELGQNFLIDDNILGVIGRAAELEAGDVVLEVGGGLGVLSEYLAERVGHLHVVEVDRSLQPALDDALAPFANATLHVADAVGLDLGALDPAPVKVVANLPYGVAATVLLKSLEELPHARLWVAMVQREVGERLAAGPGSKTYGVTSVLAQLASEVRVERRVPRTVFHPVPNVESALVVLRRTGPWPGAQVAAFVHAAFAHRRKALAGSLALAPGAPPDVRERARAALEAMGHPADARAERLAPAELAALALELAS